MSDWRVMLASDRPRPKPVEMGRCQGRARHLGPRAAVSLEFAILATAFLILAFGAMELGYDFFVQAALDNAVNLSARGIQVGRDANVGGSGSGANFVRNAVCPNLGTLLDCNLLYVAVTPINTNNYYDYFINNPPSLNTITGSGTTNGSGDPVNTGAGCQPMVVEAYYVGPTFLGTLVPGFSTQWIPHDRTNAVLTHVTYSAAGFVNENFGGSSGGC